MKYSHTGARTVLVLGYGNTLRSDDGAGPAVIEELEKFAIPGVTTISRGLLTPELAEVVSRFSAIVFVDATIESPSEVRIRPVKAADSSQVMAHAADPGTVLALARDIFGVTPEAWLVTIPAVDLGMGESFSAVTKQGVTKAVELIRAFVERLQTSPL